MVSWFLLCRVWTLLFVDLLLDFTDHISCLSTGRGLVLGSHFVLAHVKLLYGAFRKHWDNLLYHLIQSLNDWGPRAHGVCALAQIQHFIIKTVRIPIFLIIDKTTECLLCGWCELKWAGEWMKEWFQHKAAVCWAPLFLVVLPFPVPVVSFLDYMHWAIQILHFSVLNFSFGKLPLLIIPAKFRFTCKYA